MERNKQIYALSDAALVVKSDHGHGGTWAGATEQLEKYRYVCVYARHPEEPCAGFDALVERGARPWPEPQDPHDLQVILSDDGSWVPTPIGPTQRSLFPSEREAGSDASFVREGAPMEFDEKTVSEPGSASDADGRSPGNCLCDCCVACLKR